MKKFDDLSRKLYGIFIQAFRNIGIAINSKQQEDLRVTLTTLALEIGKAAEQASVAQAKALQEGVKKGFKMLEKDINLIENRVYAIEKQLEIDVRDPVKKEEEAVSEDEDSPGRGN